MDQFFTIVKMIAQLYPMLMDIIKAIEVSIPASGQGAAKLALVKATLESAYDSMGNAQLKFEQLWPTLQLVISSMVTMLNVSGVFKK